MATPFSVIILAKNESAAIVDCIRSVSTLTDAVVVVDSASTDDTCALATSLGAKVVQFEWNGKYPKKKEWAVTHLSLPTDWVLLLDADERVSPELASELQAAVNNDGLSALDIPLEYYWRRIPLRHGQTVLKRSFFRRSVTSFPHPADLAAPGITEVEGHYQPRVTGKVGRAKSKLLHDDPDPLADWFGRHNRYSDWEAYLREHPGARMEIARSRSFQGRILDALPFKPVVVFLFNYVLKSGWRDGRAGLEYATSLAFYQYQISMKAREMSSASSSH